MNKNRYNLTLTICVFFLGVFLSLPLSLGATVEKTNSIYTDREAYISASNPFTNYGATELLYINDFWYRAFIHFDLTDKPSNITKVEVVLAFFYIYETTTITIYIADNNTWQELTLTWQNAPSYSTTIYTGVISEDGRFSFELPSASHQWTEVSLVVKSSETTDFEFDTITTKDYQYLIYEQDVPHIKYTYLAEAPSPPFISGYNIFIVIGVLGIFSIFVLNRNKIILHSDG